MCQVVVQRRWKGGKSSTECWDAWCNTVLSKHGSPKAQQRALRHHRQKRHRLRPACHSDPIISNHCKLPCCIKLQRSMDLFYVVRLDMYNLDLVKWCTMSSVRWKPSDARAYCSLHLLSHVLQFFCPAARHQKKCEGLGIWSAGLVLAADRLENHITELYRILILSADACATFQTFQSSTDVQYRTVAVSGALALTSSLWLRLPSLQFDSLL